MAERKKVIIHDLPGEAAAALFAALEDDYAIIDANRAAAKCTGCFQCWLKNPGLCRFRDHLETAGQLVLSSERLILITEMLYGGVSIPVKRVLDRSIPGVTPFFIKKKGQLHHLQRYPSQTQIKAVFYNAAALTDAEKKQGQDYIEAMGINYHSKHNEVLFIDTADLSGGVL